jgi:hypothetical protein
MGVVSTGQITLYDQNETPMPELSSEIKVVPSNADGSNPVLSGAASTFSVKLGTTDITNLYAVSATPSSGISGSLSGTTYTVSGMTVDSGYVDFSATRAGWPTLTKRFNLAKQKQGQKGDPGTNGQDAPRCLGLFAYASRSSITGMITNDLAVLYSTTQSERGIYQYSGSAWSKLSSPTADQQARCFLSVLDAVQQGYGTSADYISGSTSFETLLTKFLYALQITLDAKGWQKSSNYAEDTDGYPTSGFILDALNNVIKSFGSVFTQTIIKNAYFSGEIDTAALKTQQPQSIAAKSWTTANTHVEVYNYFNSLINGVNYFFDSTFTCEGKTVTHAIRFTNFLYFYTATGDSAASFGLGNIPISFNFTNSSITFSAKVTVDELSYDHFDHLPFAVLGTKSNTSFTLTSIDVGYLVLTPFVSTNANTDYTITLPSGGTWNYLISYSGTYYASISSKAGYAYGGTASGGTTIATINKGGSGNLSGFVLHWREPS